MSSERPRVVLLGLGPTAESAYEGLSGRGDLDVVGLVRDDPAGQDPLVDRARAAGAEVPDGSDLAAVRDLVRRLRPDVVVVSSYHRVLPPDLLVTCRFVNVHYAPLPRYRGRANVNWMIINGEREAALSIHTVVPGLDAGGILHQERVPIGPRDTVGDVYRHLNARQRDTLADAVARHLGGDEGIAQDDRDATYGCTRIDDDGEIDWSATTTQVDRLIRAVAEPYPAAFTFLGLDVVRVLEAWPVEPAPVFDGRVPGRVVAVDRTAGTVDVLTGDGVLRVATLRREGGAPERAADLAGSVRTTFGLRGIDVVRALNALRRSGGGRLTLPGHPVHGGA